MFKTAAQHEVLDQSVRVILESLSQEEALLDIIVGGVGGVDVFNPRETPADSAIFIYSL